MPLFNPDAGLPAIAASNTTYSTEAVVVLSGSNNLTVSYNASTILFSVPSAATPMQVIASGSAYSTGTVVISGSAAGNVTVSYNASTILLSGPAAMANLVMSSFNNLHGAQTLTSTNATASTRSLFIFPLHPYDAVWPADITASTARILMSVSYTTTATNVAAMTLTAQLGIYKVSGSGSAATLSLINSVGLSFGSAGTRGSTWVSQSMSGIRWWSVNSSVWSSNPVFYEGSVYYGAFFSSSGGPSIVTWALYGASVLSTMNISGAMGEGSVSATSVGLPVWAGVYTNTTNALPTQILSADVNRQAAMANFVPLIEFDMLTRSH